MILVFLPFKKERKNIFMVNKPLIFITNDDGYQAKGIRELISIVKDYGDIVVVAPNKEMSGKSHSITVGSPLRLLTHKEEDGYKEYSLEGTPVDCVKMAFNQILKRLPDFLIAGINHGSNASINTIYSGTMAAVMEGCQEGIPSIGFSLNDDNKDADFSFCLPYIKQITEQVIKDGLKEDICLNVNFPQGEILGTKICHQAKAYWNEDFKTEQTKEGKDVYWLSGVYHCTDTSPRADYNAMMNHYASIVPMQVDFTAYNMIDDYKKRFEK
jgi:5'-nucleotidase